MQFYWAWVNSSETTYGPAHARYDEKVFSFTITHREGECAQLSLVIKNPKIGLLAAGRKVWGWLSFSDSGTAGAQPLFFGRLLGIPDMAGSATGFAELLTLTFVAKPIDFHAQRRALAEQLAVLPFYDKLFIDPKLRIDASIHTGDVDTALEARSARWHCSRGEDGGPLVVSISDICIGEDGTEVFESSTAAPAGVDPTSVNLRIAGAPVTSVSVKASLGWTQTMAVGQSIDVFGLGFSINSFTDSILSSWPKAGAGIGGGWVAGPGTFAVDIADVANLQNTNYNFTWHNTAKKHKTGDPMSTSVSTSTPVVKGPFITQLLYEDKQSGIIWAPAFGMPADVPPTFSQWSDLPGPDSSGDVINIPLHYDAQWVVIPQYEIAAGLVMELAPNSGRARTENLVFTMTSDVQPVLTDPSDFDTSSSANPPDENILEINGADPTILIDGVAPLPSASMQNYFTTDRGQLSIEYFLLRARALLLNGARLVELLWSVPFNRAVAFTCRKNATLVWNDLPGGRASGKITQYTISADGSSGKIGGTVTVMATVGRGAASETSQYVPVAGDLYVNAGYVSDGMFGQLGQQTPVVGNPGTSTAGGFADVAYSPPVVDTIDTRFPTTAADLGVIVSVSGAIDAQAAAIRGALDKAASAATDLTAKKNASAIAAAAVASALEQSPAIAVSLTFPDATGSGFAFTDEVDVAVQPLMVPQTINLEA